MMVKKVLLLLLVGTFIALCYASFRHVQRMSQLAMHVPTYPDHPIHSCIQPFGNSIFRYLILSHLFYVVICLLYVVDKTQEHRRKPPPNPKSLATFSHAQADIKKYHNSIYDCIILLISPSCLQIIYVLYDQSTLIIARER